MTINELIEQLQQVENKELEVYVYDVWNGDLIGIDNIDTNISDRVDINIKDRS